MPKAQKMSPSVLCFKQDWRWTVLDICPNDSKLPPRCLAAAAVAADAIAKH